jgi:hypothetical protein
MSQCPSCGAAYAPSAPRCHKCGGARVPPPLPGAAGGALLAGTGLSAAGLATAGRSMLATAAGTVQGVLPQTTGLRHCRRCKSATAVEHAPITRGELSSSCLEKIAAVCLSVVLFPVGLLYPLYLYYRKVWVCPTCGARDPL